MEILENSHVAWKNVRIETVLGQIWNESVCVCVCGGTTTCVHAV